ncbi:hypothetical protein ACFL08_00585 [Patescibacteria group bacterium]
MIDGEVDALRKLFEEHRGCDFFLDTIKIFVKLPKDNPLVRVSNFTELVRCVARNEIILASLSKRALCNMSDVEVMYQKEIEVFRSAGIGVLVEKQDSVFRVVAIIE